MKIEQRGFRIADISERVAGVDGEDGELLIVFVDPNGGEDLSPRLQPDDVKALIEALQVAHRLMTDSTASLPATLTDQGGDVWRRIAETERYSADASGRTAAWIEENYGLRQS